MDLFEGRRQKAEGRRLRKIELLNLLPSAFCLYLFPFSIPKIPRIT